MKNDKKVLFLHIPKTAGSSLLSSEVGQAIDDRVHAFVGDIEEKIGEMGATNHFKFCFTRNPWSRFSSLYHYFFNMKEDHMFFRFNPSIIKLVRRYDTFEKFCLAFPELAIKNFHFYPQSKYIFSNGQKVPDFIGRVETLDQDVYELARQLDIVITKPLPHSNQSNTLDYRDLYSTKMREVVAQSFFHDVNELGYSF
jgi:hypothetical protein